VANTIRNKRGTTKPAASDLVTGEIAVKTDDAKLFIENDSGYVFEVGETLGTYSSTTITYTVTVASKTSAHRYNGTGSSNGYKINGIFAPFLSLTAGNTYKFDQSDSSNSGHPLRFYLEADKTTAYTTNVTTNGTAGSSGAYTQIVITDATPIILHYQCSAHGYMGNSVTSNGTSINGSNITSGTIPDARLPDPLPAISGANLTSLPSSLIIQEEGSSLSTAATTLNFVGSSVTATGSGATKTITISGGGGGLSSDAQKNTVAGTNAGDSFTGTDALSNTLFGYDAGTAMTSADLNVGIGVNALQAATNSEANVAIGYEAGKSVTTGFFNTHIGAHAGKTATTAYRNTFIGYNCGRDSTDLDNTAVGYHAMRYGGGYRNVAIGYECTQASGGAGDANFNTSIGYRANSINAYGSFHVAVGAYALEDAGSTYSPQSDYCVGVGYEAGKNITSGDNNICIGYRSGTTNSPSGNLTSTSNIICLGDDNISQIYCNDTTISNSDQRDKTDITSFNLGLAWVEALRPVTYRWDRRTWYGTDEQPYGTPDGSKKRTQLHVGFLAQEVLEVEKANGYGTSKDDSITVNLNEDEMSYGLKYERLVPILVNAIKELSTRVQALEAG